VAVALHPGLVLKRDEGGVSNYGIHAKTVAAYSVAFGAAIVGAFTGVARLRVGAPTARTLQLVLAGYGGLMTAALVSTYPYSLSVPFKDVHEVIGVTLVLYLVVTTGWLFAHQASSGRARAWLGAVVVGFVLSVLTLLNVLHVLFLAQVLLAAGYGTLLVSATRSVGRPPH
jgi:uncharacterized membrane protein